MWPQEPGSGLIDVHLHCVEWVEGCNIRSRPPPSRMATVVFIDALTLFYHVCLHRSKVCAAVACLY